jgi:hypothetical protein
MANIEGQRSAGDIAHDVLTDVGDIVRGEIRLAQAEIREKAGKAGGMMGAAALCGLLASACLVACCIAALALVMAVWLAALIVCVLLGGCAAALFALGRTRFKQIDPVPGRTVETAKDTLRWARHRTT